MERSEHLFVVRMWREASTGEAGWRGSVEDIESHQRLSFTKFADLIDFIALRTGDAPEPLEHQSSQSPD